MATDEKSGKLSDVSLSEKEHRAFARACHREQRKRKRPLYWSEVLELLTRLGYRKDPQAG